MHRPDNRDSDWTNVESKRKKKYKRLQDRRPEDITLEDVYNASVSNIKEKNNAHVEKNTSELIAGAIFEQTKGLSEMDSLCALGKTLPFVIDNITTILNNNIQRINKIADDQKTVIALNTILKNMDQFQNSMNSSILSLNRCTDKMKTIKVRSIQNIKKFLLTCGINEIPPQKEYTLCDEKSNKNTTPVSTDDIKMTYASAINSSASDLVVEKTPVRIVNTINPRKTVIANTGLANIKIPVVTCIRDSGLYTLSYNSRFKVFTIRIDDTIFTAGPGVFVNLKNSKGKTKHAKRCLNPQPCTYKNCKYYHDPSTVSSNYNIERKFAISYAMQLLDSVKNNEDIQYNKHIRHHNFLRDLVQLGGIILIKAAQIKKLYHMQKN